MIAKLFASVALTSLLLGPAQAAEVKTIGLAVANLQANFFNQIKQSAEAEAAKLGVKIITVDAKGDGPTQVNQVQDLLTQKIDALIYIPAGAAAATVPTKLAQAAGIPVVNIDRKRGRCARQHLHRVELGLVGQVRVRLHHQAGRR